MPSTHTQGTAAPGGAVQHVLCDGRRRAGQALCPITPSDCSRQAAVAFVPQPVLLRVAPFWDRKDFPVPWCGLLQGWGRARGGDLLQLLLRGKPWCCLFAPESPVQPGRGAGMLHFLPGLASAAGSSSASAVVASPVIGTRTALRNPTGAADVCVFYLKSLGRNGFVNSFTAGVSVTPQRRCSV